MQKQMKNQSRESLPDQAAELKKLNQKKLKRKIQNCRRKLNGMIRRPFASIVWLYSPMNM